MRGTGMKLEKVEKRAKSNAVQTIEVACPACGCDYMIPLVRLRFIKSFAGNKLQVEWPSKDTSNDYGVVGCPGCSDVLKIEPDGVVRPLGKKLSGWKSK